MRRLVALVVALAAFGLLAPSAFAHPLGNFTINHLSRISVSSDRVDVTYLLDEAEIPTFQERGLSPGTALARKRAEALRDLVLTVDGHRVPLTPSAGGTISHPPGQGGLKLTRVQLPLHAAAHDPRRVQLRDETFSDRLGWKAIVAAPGTGTAVRSTAPSGDPTNGLRNYPKDLLKSPLDERTASLAVRPGHGTLVAPRVEGGRYRTTENASGDGFAGVFADAASGKGVLLLLLLAAFGWGALHALSPGHGKTMVAGYLVGTRGTARHAVALGATVTITHTIGVFALGVVTLALSQYVLPEQLYPWLTLASGLLVVIVGVNVLRSRIRAARVAHQHHHHHHHDDLTWRSLVGMGASAGLIPCPSALVVLLGAISQHQVALGLLLILTFSLGLAMTLTALGVAVVYAGRLTTRLSFSGRVVTVLPSLSALLIVGLGLMLTLRAVPKVM